jgi:type III pantothenate kinase
MLLTIDIGNTNITLGVFALQKKKSVPGPIRIWRLETDKSKTSDEYGIKLLDMFHYAGTHLVRAEDITHVAAAGVVPSLESVFNEVVGKYFGRKTFWVSSKNKKAVKVHYGDPMEVGADRLANVAAAFNMFRKPAIVIDFGTATTFDCVNNKGEYIGGVIAPGPNIAAEALAKRTAKLPMINIVKPSKVIGNSTVECIQSGIYHGYVGLIKEILAQVRRVMKGSPVVIATGGLAGLIVSDIKEVKRVVPELTLEGIRIIWEKNRT